MAQDEMETITEDRWDEDIWGIEHEDTEHNYQIPKLILYFGENVRASTRRRSHTLTRDRITG